MSYYQIIRLKALERNIIRVASLFLGASEARNVREMTFHFGELEEYNTQRLAILAEAVSK